MGAPPAPHQPADAGPAPPGVGWRRTAGWICLGTGGASLVVGFVLGALAKSTASEYSAGVAQGKTFAALEEIDGRGQAYQTGQIAALIIGGAMAAGGAGLLLWDWSRRRGRPSKESTAWLQLLATHDRWTLSAHGRF